LGLTPPEYRTITGATAAERGLLGAVLGAAGATIAGLAWARSSLSATFGNIPALDLICDPGRPAPDRRRRRLAPGRPPTPRVTSTTVRSEKRLFVSFGRQSSQN
jgi:hypothetical protein